MSTDPQPYTRYVTMINEVLEDDRLTPFQKILWALIDTLSKKGDICTASNSWLAQKMCTSQGNLANELSKLRSLGFLLAEVDEEGRRGLITVYEGDRRLQNRMAPGVQSQLMRGSATTEHPISSSLSDGGVSNIDEIKVKNKQRTECVGDVELPAGFPKTEAAAIAMGSMIGCSKEFTVKIWDLAVSRGGRDHKDVIIRSFSHHLKIQKTYAEEHAAKETKYGKSRNEPPSRNEGTHNNGDYEKYRHLEYGYKPPQGSGPDEPDQGVK